MPHCILEYSSNINDKINLKKLLHDINTMLAGTGLFNLMDIKSRAVEHDLYVVGDGDPNRAFAGLTISIFSGRPDDVKANITESALQLLKDAFNTTLQEKKCSITVQLVDIHRESYRRINSVET
jgi:5-carboxymethyl-2-hydroxymuconate isomerase